MFLYFENILKTFHVFNNHLAVTKQKESLKASLSVPLTHAHYSMSVCMFISLSEKKSAAFENKPTLLKSSLDFLFLFKESSRNCFSFFDWYRLNNSECQFLNIFSSFTWGLVPGTMMYCTIYQCSELSNSMLKMRWLFQLL